MVHGKNRIPYWIDRRLTGLAGPDYHATISFGLPFESEDSQYGKYRTYTTSWDSTTTKIVNVLAKLPKRQQDQAKLMLRTIPYAPTRTEAERLRTVFTRWCGDHSYEAASEALERDWDRMVTFYDFPKEH